MCYMLRQRRHLHLARESEARLTFALNAAGIGDWDMDLRTNVARRSLRQDQCFGYAAAIPEWGYDTILAHVHEDDRSRVDARFKAAMGGDGEYDVKFRTLWPDGTTHWLWSSSRLCFDERGAPYRVAGIVVDVTTRKAHEAAIERAVSSWNRAAERIFGYPAEEIIGTSITRLIPATRHAEEAEILDKVRLGTSMEHFETVRVRKDGRLIDVFVTVSPIRARRSVARRGRPDAAATGPGEPVCECPGFDARWRAVDLPRGQGELVLVVDDEPSIRQITQKTLEAFGYRVVVASDGAEAVALYAQRGDEIVVVLTDMMMPVMDGAATIRVLRKLNPAVRIVAASGLVNNGHGSSAGLRIRHFLPKPYAAEALLTVLRSCIDETR